jgi:ABC-type transport system involved in multi-copper enzyme maturation permease subunit
VNSNTLNKTSNVRPATPTSRLLRDRVSDDRNDLNGSSRNRIFALAKHEYRAAVRSKALVALLVILVGVTTASVYIAAVTHRTQVADYQTYKTAAQASGLKRIAPSPLAPMSLLRGAIEYLQIIGSVIAITLGFLSVQRERSNRTLPLLRSRPVSSNELAVGTLLGAVGLIATLVFATAIVGVLCIGLIGNDWINGADVLQLFLAYLASIIYMTGFYALGVFATAKTKNATNGLFLALCFWLVVVLVFPQIGDTLDSDNQVPGGLFKAIGLNRADENTVLQKFTIFETIRTRIEYISFAQHYQRFAFAMADVKERYRPLDLGGLMARVWTDLSWVLAWPMLLIAGQRKALRNQPTLPEGATS